MLKLDDKESGYAKGSLFRVVDVAGIGTVSAMMYQYIQDVYGQKRISAASNIGIYQQRQGTAFISRISFAV